MKRNLLCVIGLLCYLLDYSVRIRGRRARSLWVYESISQGWSRISPRPSQPSMWGKLCSWRWAQDVLGGVVIEHEVVVMGGPQIIGTPYHSEELVPKYGLQHLQILVVGMVLNFLTTSPPRSKTSCTISGPTSCKGLDPFEYELYDSLGVLQFHEAPDSHPQFELDNMKETA